MNLIVTTSPGWNPTNARELAIYAQRAYSAGPWLSTEPVPRWVSDRETDTQAFVQAFADYVVIGFRGTSSLKDFIIDAEFLRTELFRNGVESSAEVHSGFLRAYASIVEQLHTTLADLFLGDRPIFLTGHSLGGALAVLAALELKRNNRYNVHSVYTYGQPRVGNAAFKRLVEQALGDRYQRHVFENDIVARLPHLPTFGDPYRHAGGEIVLNARGEVVLNPTTCQLLWLELKNAWRALFVEREGVLTDALRDHHIANYIRGLS